MMQNLQKRWNRFTSVLAAIKHGKASGQWSFLFVKENGEIISVDRIKELTIMLVAIVLLMGITTTVFSFLYKSEKGKNEHLKKALKTSEQKIAALQEEKDVLMVRLVLAESKAKNRPPDPKGGINESYVESSPNTSIHGEKSTNTDDISPKLKDTTETAPDVKTPAIVNIKNEEIFHDTKKNILNVKFILKTTNMAEKTVSGRAFIMLKRNKDDVDPLVIPSVPLSSGKPSQIKRGQYFSIAHFKWMNFKKKNQPTIKPFKYLAVFIFSTKGKLLLEKEINIGDML